MISILRFCSSASPLVHNVNSWCSARRAAFPRRPPAIQLRAVRFRERARRRGADRAHRRLVRRGAENTDSGCAEVDRAIAWILLLTTSISSSTPRFFRGRERGVVQIFAELPESLLEIDVVFPEGIVGRQISVEAGHRLAWVRGARRKGISTMTSTSTGSSCRVAG